MATAAPEDHEKIRELQASLRRVLDHWDATHPDQQTEAFSRVVPVADDLVAAHQARLREQAELKADQVRDWVGRVLFLLAALLPTGIVLLLDGSAWWLLAIVPLLAAGMYLQISRRTRG
jgi:hypothetical protein